jgi:hypothetical protein
MATKKRNASPKVAEAAPEYGAKPVSETFWLAFQELPDLDRVAFFERLIEDEELREDLLDSIVIMNRRGEPTRPFEEFVEELRRDGRL